VLASGWPEAELSWLTAVTAEWSETTAEFTAFLDGPQQSAVLVSEVRAIIIIIIIFFFTLGRYIPEGV